MENSIDRFVGCFLGLALGDALGAPFEGGPLERFVWRLIGKTREGEIKWTDDTQMSLDLAESLIAMGALEPDDLAERFADSYSWSRGYGPGAARLLKRIRGGMPWQEANRVIYSEGSYGNGAAMRAPIIGLFFSSRPSQLVAAARDSALVTHAHPLGIEGAVLIASAISKALISSSPTEILAFAAGHCQEVAFEERLEVAGRWIRSGDSPDPAEVAKRLGHGIAAPDSCATALYLGLRFLAAPFTELHTFVVECGGDVDTIGAMAGAIWGAANGASELPEEDLRVLEQRARIEEVAGALQGASVAHS